MAAVAAAAFAFALSSPLGLLMLYMFGICLFFIPSIAAANDVSRASASGARPGCGNDFRMVLVKRWVSGAEEDSLTGSAAAFGSLLPVNLKQARRFPAIFSDPVTGCLSSYSELSGSIALVLRGYCDFIAKARLAQAGGATGLVVINNDEGLEQMACSMDNSALNITIPVIMISQIGGNELDKSITRGEKVELLLYSPNRPTVEYSTTFLWLLAP